MFINDLTRGVSVPVVILASFLSDFFFFFLFLFFLSGLPDLPGVNEPKAFEDIVDNYEDRKTVDERSVKTKTS